MEYRVEYSNNMVACDVDVEGAVLDEMEDRQLKDVLWGMVDSLPGDQPQISGRSDS